MLIGIALGVGATWSFGLWATHYSSVEEAKLCHFALTQQTAKLHPQTREYLKGRYYWNAAVWISPSWMSGWMEDFGPVDDAALEGLDPIKDASSTDEVRLDALKKHGVQPRHPASPQPEK